MQASPRRILASTFVILGLLGAAFVQPAAAAVPTIVVGIGDVRVVEGDAGEPNAARFTVTLSKPSATDVTIGWTLSSGTATAGADFKARPKPQTVKIKAGKTSSHITVRTFPDTDVEADETFQVTLTSVLSGPASLAVDTVGTGTILDDDPSAGTTASIGDATIVETDEGTTRVAVPFTLSSPVPASTVVVHWSVSTNGTMGDDLKQISTRATKFNPGRTRAVEMLALYGDYTPDPGETVFVSIDEVDVVGPPAPVTVGRSSGSVDLVDDDAVLSGSTLFAMGCNCDDQLGTGDERDHTTPNRLGTTTGWTSVDAGAHYSLGLRDDGTLWSWGWNGWGQLGLGDFDNRDVPTQVGTDTDWVAISGGRYHGLAIKADGTLWGWGRNNVSQLGTGDTTDLLVPTQIGTDTDWSSISASLEGHSLAIKDDGTLWAWGSNIFGQLGTGDEDDHLVPTQVGTDTDWSTASAGLFHSAATKSDGTAWAWGFNLFGELGSDDDFQELSPTQVGTDTNWSVVRAGVLHSTGIRTDGTLWTWGINDDGELGLGDTAEHPGLNQVGTDTNWATIDTSDFSLAVRTDGTLWSWGWNDFGQGGQGDLINRLSPDQVGTDTAWTAVTVGAYHSLAIQTNP